MWGGLGVISVRICDVFRLADFKLMIDFDVMRWMG